MLNFGKTSTRCHGMKIQAARQLKHYTYRCGCPQPTYLTSIRHRRAQKAGWHYRCARCAQPLLHVSAA